MKRKSIEQFAMKSFMESFNWANPVAITLTVKRTIQSTGGWVCGNEYHYNKTIRHFINKLNRKIFGNKSRKGVGLKSFCVREVCVSGRPHFHLQIDRPDSIDFAKFEQLISDIWASIHWAYERVDIKPVYDRGWSSYMTKVRSKPAAYLDAICLEGCHRGLPWRPASHACE